MYLYIMCIDSTSMYPYICTLDNVIYDASTLYITLLYTCISCVLIVHLCIHIICYIKLIFI